MTNHVRTFESIPVDILAVQWVGGPAAATPIINWILENGGTATWDGPHAVQLPDEELQVRGLLAGAIWETEGLYIQTLEGRMKASPGDWIIQGTEGEFYPCKDTVFQRKYKSKENS